MASRVDGGFESLSHHVESLSQHWVLLPEVLEGNNMVVKIATVASRASATLLLPEALEGNNKALEGYNRKGYNRKGNILKNFNNSISK